MEVVPQSTNWTPTKTKLITLTMMSQRMTILWPKILQGKIFKETLHAKFFFFSRYQDNCYIIKLEVVGLESKCTTDLLRIFNLIK